MQKFVPRFVLAVLSASAMFASNAFADGKPNTPPIGWSFALGAGGLYAPDYEGSDDYEARGLPYIRVQYADWLSLSVPEGLKLSLLTADGFRAGVLAGYRFDRDASDNIALAGWGDIDGTAELGAFAEYKIDAIRLAVDLRQGLSDNTGLQATASARYETRVAGARVSIGPQLTWVDDQYSQTYFGITPTQAAASTLGYAPYESNGGVKSFGLGASAMIPLDNEWSLTAIASVNQLTADAADSPIVAVQGSETQFTVGLFAGYRF